MKGITSQLLFALLLSVFMTSCDDRAPLSLSLDSIQETKVSPLKREAIFPLFVQSVGGHYNLDPILTQYVKRIASRIISSSTHRNIAFNFVIVNHSKPFAIAFPGYNIALSRSLFTIIENEAELAAVLAQKAIASTKLSSHPLPNEENLSNMLCNSLEFTIESIIQSQRLTLATECKIDTEVLDLLTLLGYDPKALSTFYNKIKKKDLESFLPYLSKKMQSISVQMPELEYSGYLGKKGYIETVLSLIENEPAYDILQQSLNAYADTNYEQALALAKQASKQVPNEALFHLQIGRSYWRLKKESLAIKAFTSAIHYNPLYYYPYFERGKLFDSRQKSFRAKSDYEMATEYFPSDKTLYHYGNLLFKINEKKEAMEAYEKVATFNSDYSEKARKKVARYKSRCT
ncbi:MAG: hypothetical protein P0S95_04405 [Rhabdochlamydiaceae bacterium]|nr:hypothetical protein [Candidatus Amphrikana amoebophyrae]